jgi:hypothetical protein
MAQPDRDNIRPIERLVQRSTLLRQMRKDIPFAAPPSPLLLCFVFDDP